MTYTHIRRVGVVAAALALASLLTSCELPTIHWVDSTADASDAAIGDGLCATAAGECTLRAAVQEANTATGPVRIELGDSETYTLAIAGIGENASATGDLDIAGQLTIEGHGSTIDANGIDRVLELDGTAGLSLNETTITGGHAEFAGGIRINTGTTAHIARSTITANTADGYTRCYLIDYLMPELSYCSSETVPFGFAPFGGPPSLVHLGEGGGAGIWNKGTLAVSDSTISANIVPEIPTTDFQSADECEPFVRALMCDFHVGSGLLNYATADLVNVTFSANTIADGFGAAVAEAPWMPPVPYPGIDPTTTMAFVTIVDNISTAPVEPSGPFIFLSWPLSGSAVVGSIRTGATVIDGVGPLCSTSLAPLSLGSNAGADSSCFDPAIQATDRNDLASGLGPLAANGGPTRTHLPLASSALIDSIAPCNELVPTDQRGSARAAGQPCTVGAVEP